MQVVHYKQKILIKHDVKIVSFVITFDNCFLLKDFIKNFFIGIVERFDKNLNECSRMDHCFATLYTANSWKTF